MTVDVVNKTTVLKAMEIDLNNRNCLQAIRELAMDQASLNHGNAFWRRAFVELADAADRLDAMTARCSVISTPEFRSDPDSTGGSPVFAAGYLH